MANSITTNPMVFDGVTSGAENEALNKMHYVTKVEWVAKTGFTISATNAFVVTNNAGVDCYSKYATYDGDDYGSGKLDPPDPVVGLKVTVFGGGIIKIWKSPEMG